jgi:hypothetical protein
MLTFGPRSVFQLRPVRRENHAARRVPREADDGIRTHDLLHGKQTL